MQTKLSLTQKGNISAKVVNKEEHVCALCQQKHHMESMKMLLGGVRDEFFLREALKWILGSL